MGLRTPLFYLLLLNTLIFSALPCLVFGDPVGLITACRGQATLIFEDGTRTPARMGAQVFVGQSIETDAQSTLEITFLDRSTLSLAGGAHIIIQDYQFAKGKKPKSSIKVTRGAFEFLAGEISKVAPENYQIETATATIGIRGSGGYGIAGPQGLQIRTMAGHVLDIWTVRGEHYVLRHPPLGLWVTASGVAYPLAVTHAGWIDPPLAPKTEVPNLPAPRPYKGPSQPLNTEIKLSSTEVRIVEEEQEEELEAYESPSRSMDKYLTSEEPSTAPMLKRITEQEKAKEGQKSKAPKTR